MARELAASKIAERGAVQRITEILSKSAKGRRLAENKSSPFSVLRRGSGLRVRSRASERLEINRTRFRPFRRSEDDISFGAALEAGHRPEVQAETDPQYRSAEQFSPLNPTTNDDGFVCDGIQRTVEFWVCRKNLLVDPGGEIRVPIIAEIEVRAALECARPRASLPWTTRVTVRIGQGSSVQG